MWIAITFKQYYSSMNGIFAQPVKYSCYNAAENVDLAYYVHYFRAVFSIAAFLKLTWEEYHPNIVSK